MLYSQSPPLAENETDPENRTRLARDQEARPEPQFGRRPVHASIHALPPLPRPSIGRRMFRAVTPVRDCGADRRWRHARLAGLWRYGKEDARCARAGARLVVAYLPATKPPVAVAAPANPVAAA